MHNRDSICQALEDAEALSAKLEAVGNIHSDGRPILGMDSRDLMELTLTTCPEAEFIPAHIWTPHFSMFGAFSGFCTVESCFDDMTRHIHAVETGLSSDPPMNWRVSALDGLDAGIAFGRALSCQAWQGGESSGYRPDLSGAHPCHSHRRGLFGNNRILSGRRKVSSGRTSQLRRVPVLLRRRRN